MSAPRNRREAQAQGFVVDDTCYPWVAYKGPRFATLEAHEIPTDKEAEADKAPGSAERDAMRLFEACMTVVDFAQRGRVAERHEIETCETVLNWLDQYGVNTKNSSRVHILAALMRLLRGAS